jgi:hypothetical protein
VTGESLGLLIEEQRTNLFQRSEEFDNASWTKGGVTVTANTVVAPDGTLTGDKLVEATDNAARSVLQNWTSVSGTTYTFSVYAKKGERQWLFINGSSGAFGITTRAWFDLQNGVVGTLQNSPIATIADVGNGWYRCTMTKAATASATHTSTGFYMSNADNTVAYTGDGYSGIYIWGAQLESASFSTSYIPTVASQVTRAADAASMTGANFSSWYNQAEGSFYSDFAFTGLTGVSGQRIFQADDGSNSNYLATNATSVAGMQNPIVRGGNTEATLATPATTFIANTFNKIAVGFANNNSVAAANNVLGTADTSCLLPLSLTALRFGASASSISSNLLIRKVAYYPMRVTNAQLQALTS